MLGLPAIRIHWKATCGLVKITWHWYMNNGRAMELERRYQEDPQIITLFILFPFIHGDKTGLVGTSLMIACQGPSF